MEGKFASERQFRNYALRMTMWFRHNSQAKRKLLPDTIIAAVPWYAVNSLVALETYCGRIRILLRTDRQLTTLAR